MNLRALRSACAAFCLAFAAFSAAATSTAQAAEPTGTWLTQNGDAHIRIAKCGANVCGTIVWLRNPIDATTGEAPIDLRNPDPAQRERKIMGLRIFAMAPDGSGGQPQVLGDLGGGDGTVGEHQREHPGTGGVILVRADRTAVRGR